MKEIHREIEYNGLSSVRSSIEHLGAEMENSQSGLEQYHSHRDYQLMYLDEGEIEVTVAGLNVKLFPGEVLLLGENLPHILKRASHHAGGLLLQFTADVLPAKVTRLPEFGKIVSLLRSSSGGLSIPRCEDLKPQFLAVHEAKGICRLTNLLELLDTLGNRLNTSSIISEIKIADDTDQRQTRVEMCVQFIKRHYKEEITLPRLSNAIGMNEAALCRCFKKGKGVTVMQYLARIRMENVQLLLRNTDMDVSEIAYSCGFDTVSQFNRQFKQLTGMSPTEYRKSVE